MELRHFRYFHAVAEELHFGRAAIRLNISQPPLSRQIHQLESELGVTLFDRRPGGIALTPAGQALLEGTQALLLQLELVCKRVQRADKGQVGKLAIGIRETAMYNGALPAILQAYRKKCEHVELDIIPLPSADQIEWLRTRRLDIGFVHDSFLDHDTLASEVVYVDNVVVALHCSDPLARRRKLRLSDLSEQPLIWFPRSASPRHHDRLLQACKEGGMRMNIVQMAPFVGGTALTLVAAGVGFSFVQESSARSIKPTNVVLRRVKNLNLTARLSVVWRKEESSSFLLSFLDVVRHVRDEFSASVKMSSPRR